MGTITLDTLGAAPFAYRIVADDGRDALVQLDYDYPGIASSFGWSIADVRRDIHPDCDHPATDGTIDCPDCGAEAADFIHAARVWLDDHDGATADDPGYWQEIKAEQDAAAGIEAPA